MAEDNWLGKPVATGVITARFGESGPNWTNTHTGLDFSAVTGTPIQAVQSGIVMRAGWENNAYGNVVEIAHTVAEGTLRTKYAHAFRVLVDSGEHVSKGDVIALVGSTGNTTGPHVHLEVLENGTPQNPENYLGTAVDPNPNNIGPQFGINTQLPELGNFAIRAGMFLGGVIALILALYGARKAKLI